MSPLVQIIIGIGVGIGAGITSLGILIFFLRYLITRIEAKVDKNVYDEHTKRIDEHLDAGRVNFAQMKTTQGKIFDKVNELCIEIRGGKQ